MLSQFSIGAFQWCQLSNIGHGGYDCGSRIFDNCHGQFVKDGDAMRFMADMAA
jgi:hypothetical protein